MTTSQLNDYLADGLATNKSLTAISKYKQYLVGRCHHPIKIKYFDTFVNEYREIEIPCGKCLHCRETRVNSWVQRLYAHAEHYKYVYFTTLTYSSLSDLSPLNDFVISQLNEAVWIRDSYNKLRHFCYSPSLLCKRHYQLFLKRLRRYLSSSFDEPSELSYFCCGEYGKAYGRPHFHLILFSQVPITDELVRRAWSLHYIIRDGQYVRLTNQKNVDRFSYPIGKITHEDLIASGDFDQTKRYNVLTSNNSASYTFKYVCKYMMKDSFNDSRLRLVYNSLMPDSFPLEGLALGTSLERSIAQLDLNYLHFINRVSHKVEDFSYLDQIIYPTNKYDKEKMPLLWRTFREQYRPFTECSRTHAIGKYFLLSHIAEYQDGNYVKPVCYTGNMQITASYFLRKVRQFMFSFKRLSKLPGEKPSFKQVGFSFMREAIFEKNYNVLFDSVCEYIMPDSPQVAKYLNDPSKLVYKDDFSCHRYYVTHMFGEPVVQTFVYNRSLRKYEFLGSTSLDEFMTNQLLKLNHLFNYYYLQRASQDRENKERVRLCSLLDEYDLLYHNYEDGVFDLYSSSDSLTTYLRKEIVRDYINYVFHSKSILKQEQNDF